MTISYTKAVANTGRFGVFWKLLFRWKGSVYKMIWLDLLIYTIFYIALSMAYRYGMTEEHKKAFEEVAIYCRTFVSSIPITFVLGFYVSLVVTRWWSQFEMLPWPNNLAILASVYIDGKGPRVRMMKRTIVRYANLSFALTARVISPALLKHRFPTTDSLEKEGFLMHEEKIRLEVAMKDSNGSAFWLPLIWAVALVETARKEDYIKSDRSVKRLIEEICTFRGKCGGLLSYDWISIPLVYTQVVTLAVYSYLFATIMGRQFLGEKGNDGVSHLDIYIPILTYFQLIFYLGWLKVAESLVNPFGKDDEDFDVDGLIDRNLKNSYLITEKMMDGHPELQEDKHWHEIFHLQGENATLIKFQTDDEEEHKRNLDEPEEEHLLKAMEAGIQK